MFQGGSGDNDYYIFKDPSETLISSSMQSDGIAGTVISESNVDMSGNSIRITTTTT